MDYPLAIHRNRTALLAVVAAIVALIGGREGGGLARRVRSAALALLRPAEAALRRLILIAARGLVVAPRGKPAIAALGGPRPGGTGTGRTPAFRLFDRRKRFGRLLRPAPPRGVPRIRSFGAWPAPAVPAAPATARILLRPDPDAPVAAESLRRRLAAFERALADLPRQARRLARWRARASARSPLRPGRPPGWRARADRAVDRILRECHALALDAVADTS